MKGKNTNLFVIKTGMADPVHFVTSHSKQNPDPNYRYYTHYKTTKKYNICYLVRHFVVFTGLANLKYKLYVLIIQNMLS